MRGGIGSGVTSLAFLADQAFYRVPGGIGTYQRRLVPAMAAVAGELDVTLFHGTFPRPPPPEEWMKGFRLIRLPQKWSRLYLGWALLGRPGLPASISELDVLHTPSPNAVPPAGRRQRLIVTVHDLAFLRHPDAFPPAWRMLFRLGVLRAGRRADTIIVPSQSTASDMDSHRMGRLTDRVHVIPLAPSLDVTEVDPAPVLARLGVPTSFLLNVGTLEPRKNLARLIRAYRHAVIEAKLDHALVLAGPRGWHRDELTAAIREPGPGRIITTGPVSGVDLDCLYRAAQAFVYPSLYEGFGLPVVDALARGVPTVASDSSSLPEVTGDAAVLVDPTSEEELAAAIVRVVTDADEAKRLGEAGRARARLFSWERTARETLRAYEKVLR